MLIFLIFLFSASEARTQSPVAERIAGTWRTADKTGEVTIYKVKDRYFGKITGGSSDQKFDIYNPDKARHKDPLIGLVILKDLEYQEDGEWKAGTIYDPKNGKKYSCQVTLIDPDHLKITGYIGFSWIGRSEEWKRIE